MIVANTFYCCTGLLYSNANTAFTDMLASLGSDMLMNTQFLPSFKMTIILYAEALSLFGLKVFRKLTVY